MIGLFEGAMYQKEGWYRPALYCQMNSNYKPFCSVCAESHVVQFYAHVSPIKRKYPDRSVIKDPADTTVFSVETYTPHPNTLTITWLLDGEEVYSGSELPLNAVSPASKEYIIAAIVRDTTPLVRNPSVKNILTDSATWHINPSSKTVTYAPSRTAYGLLSAAVRNNTLVIRGFQNNTRSLQVAVYTPQGKCVLSDRRIEPSHSIATISLPQVKMTGGMYIVALYDRTSPVRRSIKMLLTE